MKKRIYLPVLIAALAILIIIGSCTTTKRAIPDADFLKFWTGTWVGAEPEGIGIRFHKTIFQPDGSYDYYYKINGVIFCDTTNFTFNEKWIDSEGNVWYKARWKNSHYAQGYSLGKFSNSGNAYEELWKFGDEPIEKWAPGGIGYFHFMWVRKE